MHDHPQPQHPTGALVAIAGGAVAQVAPTTSLQVAGLITSVAGLMAAGYQWWKAWLDSKQYERQIKDLKDDLQATQDNLSAARKARHDDANKFNGMFAQIQDQLYDSKLEAARLKGHLERLDNSHAPAINDNGENMKAVADVLNMPLPKPIPHVDPINPSDDDTPALTSH